MKRLFGAILFLIYTAATAGAAVSAPQAHQHQFCVQYSDQNGSEEGGDAGCSGFHKVGSNVHVAHHIAVHHKSQVSQPARVQPVLLAGNGVLHNRYYATGKPAGVQPCPIFLRNRVLRL